MQTAEVVAHALGVDGIEVRDSLYANSVDAFMTELVEEQGTVIAVGHNPFMDELYARLSGAPQGMGTGAMASFGFAATDDPTSVGSWLEWFVQGPACRALAEHRRCGGRPFRRRCTYRAL